MGIREEVLSQIGTVEYVSFDVYDTLLFRMVRSPERIFEKTYQENPSLFPEYIDACEWREIRMKSEWFAKEEKKTEVTLEDIYNRLPSIISNPEEIKEAEIACEKRYSYLNPDMEALLLELTETYQKKVILVSDMYLTGENIAGILQHNGLNMKLISEVFVSSDSGYSKRNGSLYDFVTERLACAPERILHIGDNRAADYVKAKEKGIKAVYYPLLSEAFSKYPYLVYENEAYGSICDGIHALRILAAGEEISIGDEKQWWHGLGAMIIGPLLTCATEWVIDVAEQNDIHNIYPMMREGKFLTELLKREQTERGWTGTIKPMYISRAALYPALLSVIKRKDIKYSLATHKMTVGHLLKLYRIFDESIEFSPYLEKTMSECQDIFVGEESLYNRLEKYLCSSEMIQNIRTNNAHEDTLLFEYLQGLDMDSEPYITYDVGWRGNAQNAIQRILNKNGISTKGIHLLVNGKKFMVSEHNLEDGCDIRGFSSNFGKNEKIMNEINIPIFEMFMMCDEGTTAGYEKKGTEVTPVLKSVKYNEQQLQAMRYVQDGVLSFQSRYFELRRKKKELLLTGREELLAIVGRMMNYPTGEEAAMIGGLSYDQNFGIDSSWQIVSKSLVEKYREFGYAEFVDRKLAREDEWYQGMDACIEPLESYRRLMFGKKHYVQFKYYLFAERIAKIEGMFNLVGAGVHLNDVVGFLRLMNRVNDVEMVLDSNKLLYETKVCGFSTNSFSGKPKSKNFIITATNSKVIEEISNKLIMLFGTESKIYTM